MKNHWLEKWENEQDEKIEEIEERIAIMEYDGGLTRHDAENRVRQKLKNENKDVNS